MLSGYPTHGAQSRHHRSKARPWRAVQRHKPSTPARVPSSSEFALQGTLVYLTKLGTVGAEVKVRVVVEVATVYLTPARARA